MAPLVGLHDRTIYQNALWQSEKGRGTLRRLERKWTSWARWVARRAALAMAMR